MKQFLLSVLLFALLASCNKTNITEPEPEPGRRDYVWDVAEIKPGDESLYLTRIWGSSPVNVYAVGASSYSATSIWHFNGIRWKCDSIPRYVQPQCVWGTSESDIWLGNLNSTLWRYNGASWNRFGEYKLPGFDVTFISGMVGTSSQNIYAVGAVQNNSTLNYKAAILKYNGTNWNFLTVPETKVGLGFVEIDTGTNVLVISGTKFEDSKFTAKLYCWDGVELKELLSELGGWSRVSKLGDEIYAGMNSKIYKYENKQLILWKDNKGTKINGNIICGRSRNDFFIGSEDGVMHYNGSDFKIVYPSSWRVGLGIIFETEVFFVGYENNTGKNYIIHGKLK